MSVKDWMKECQDDLDKAGAKAAAAEGKLQKEVRPIEKGLPRDLEIALLSKLITPTPSEHGFVNQVPSDSLRSGKTWNLDRQRSHCSHP